VVTNLVYGFHPVCVRAQFVCRRDLAFFKDSGQNRQMAWADLMHSKRAGYQHAEIQ
tara:strand:- start:454 stop:621 length:168 start_codon:yes stop_codon:yes gene_type:complete